MQLTYEVAMTCGGCSKAITALVSKVEGVKSVDADWESKKVVVTGDGIDAAAVTAAISKSGKAILSGPQ
jgi:copper chaperone